ncbi:MAG: hypothetical protein M3R66_12290 [Actinomycetota bacterium]|nr:hypothetical protein [Actinomycetota bacterium]
MTTLAVVLAVIGLGVWLLRRDHLARPGTEIAEPVDLDVRLDAAFAEMVDQRDELIASRLDQVVIRQVPVRRLEAVPELHTVRLCFADGTRMFGKGAKPGDLGVLSMLVAKHVVRPTRSRRDGAGNHLMLRVEGRREPVDVVITGLDQPD